MGLLLISHCYATMALALFVFSIWSNFFTFVLVIMIIGSRQLGLAILMHDAAHGALVATKSFNEKLGSWLCGSPILADLFSYRHYHLKHHKHCQTNEDPDRVLSAPFPITRYSLLRKIFRDVSGQTGVKSVYSQILNAFRLAFDDDAVEHSDKHAQTFKSSFLFRPVICNIFIFAVMWYIGAWWWWFTFWLLPLVTWFQVVIRIRNIAEHAGTEFSTDELQNVRTTYANPLMRLLVAPYWVNYHLEHHLIMHLPCWKLSKVHKLMIQKGYAKKMKLAKSYAKVLREVIV